MQDRRSIGDLSWLDLNITANDKTEAHLRHPSRLLVTYTNADDSVLILYIPAQNNTNFPKDNNVKNKNKLTWQSLASHAYALHIAPCVLVVGNWEWVR